MSPSPISDKRWGRRRFGWRWLVEALALIIGVTLLSFSLIVYFGPDLTYKQLGKNPTAQEIAQVRSALGYDQPFWQRYGSFLGQLLRADLGVSDDSGEPIRRILGRTVPVSLMLLLPGFVLGNVLGMAGAMRAAWQRNQWPDRLLSGSAVLGMSLSFPVVIILCRWLFSSHAGLGWFPVQGWEVHDWPSYLNYVSVPTLALLTVTLGYNLRYYRALLVEELNKDYVLTARANGAGGAAIMLRHVLGNIWVPVVTRILFSLPSLLIGGSLLLETYFSIPGVGREAYNAVISGDQSLLLALVTLTAVLFALMNLLIDPLYAWVDPRLRRRPA
ncbi:MAG: ABC transporter permease [Wenzhouxiangellaceae bacterium]